jgi:hypothetical protein
MLSKRLAFISPGLLILAGCASTSEPGLDPSLATTQTERGNYDKRYVATVQHLADERGTRVIWVNPPRKKEKRVDDI